VRLYPAVLEAAVELVVLAAAVDPDDRPHVVVMGEQVHVGRPDDVERGELFRAVPDRHHRADRAVPHLGLNGGRIRNRPVDDLLDGSGCAIIRPHRRQAFGDEFVLIELVHDSPLRCGAGWEPYRRPVS
jgi:hypothetical protein